MTMKSALVRIKGSALLAAKLVKWRKLTVHKGAPHGMCITHKGEVEDLLASIRPRFVAALGRNESQCRLARGVATSPAKPLRTQGHCSQSRWPGLALRETDLRVRLECFRGSGHQSSSGFGSESGDDPYRAVLAASTDCSFGRMNA
jgi:hypothetical protein